MSKLLLVVAPQIDFITGTLPVPGAEEALAPIAQFITDSNGEYAYKVVTTDWHPYNHCSFVEQGGQWPVHCVQFSAGAGIYQPLIAPLNETSGYTQVLTKGTFADAEEYSIFRNQLSAEHLHKVITVLGITQIDVCGLAGDVCVLNTLTDGVKRYGAPMFRVLTKYVSSLDGGKALSEFIAAHGIATL